MCFTFNQDVANGTKSIQNVTLFTYVGAYWEEAYIKKGNVIKNIII